MQQQQPQQQQQQLLLQQQQQQVPAWDRWDNPLTPWAPGQSSGSQAPSLAMQQARLLQQMQLQQVQQQQLLLQQQQLQQQQQQGPGWDKSKAPWNAPPAAAPPGAPSDVDIADRAETFTIIKQMLLRIKKEELLAHATLDDTTEQEEDPADVGPKRPEGCMNKPSAGPGPEQPPEGVPGPEQPPEGGPGPEQPPEGGPGPEQPPERGVRAQHLM
jgi:hypothetical protein